MLANTCVQLELCLHHYIFNMNVACCKAALGTQSLLLFLCRASTLARMSVSTFHSEIHRNPPAGTDGSFSPLLDHKVVVRCDNSRLTLMPQWNLQNEKRKKLAGLIPGKLSFLSSDTFCILNYKA